MASPRVSRRLRRYLKENVFDSTHKIVPRLYDFSLLLLRDNLAGNGVILNFGCGPFPVELNARVLHLNEGFPTRFLNIDISPEACTRHKEETGTLVTLHKNRFPHDRYLSADIERLRLKTVRKALRDETHHGGVAISFLEYYSPPRAVKMISRMLTLCDTLVCSVRVDPEFEKIFDAEHHLKLYFFRDLQELKHELVHDDWTIEKIIGVPRYSDGERGIFLMLLTNNYRPTRRNHLSAYSCDYR